MYKNDWDSATVLQNPTHRKSLKTEQEHQSSEPSLGLLLHQKSTQRKKEREHPYVSGSHIEKTTENTMKIEK